MQEVKILDATGEPIRKEALTKRKATPSLTGLRQPWANLVAPGLTPAKLAGILERATAGDIADYLGMCEDMEERDPHYAAVLGTRKRAVEGLPVVVEAATDSAKDVALADEIRLLTQAPEFIDAIQNSLDALGKGFAVSEIEWQRSAKQYWPMAYHYVDPRWFKLDRETGQHLRLLDEANPAEGIPLVPYAYITHLPKLKCGLPIRGGLGRLVAFSWICKAYGQKDWTSIAEIAGVPLRLGRYGPRATEEDVRILRAAVTNLGSDAAAVLPESMRIDFEQAPNLSGAADLFEKLCEYLDRQISKAVLGQTMTMDNGSSQAQAKVHQEVREDILRADARTLSATLNRDLVKPYIDLNHGAQAQYPRITIQVVDKEDIAGLTSALEKLVPMGLRVEESVIRDKLGLPDPDEGAALLAAPQAASNPLIDAVEVPAANRAPVHPEPVEGLPAIAANRAGQALNDVERMTDRLSQETDATITDWYQVIRELLDEVDDLNELPDLLEQRYQELDAADIAQLMGQAYMAAELGGRSDVLDEGDTDG